VGKFRLPARRADEVVAFVRDHAELVEPAQVPEDVCPDPDDLPVLGTAVAGLAEVLVTGDGDLLALGNHAGTAIVTPRECYRRLA
jgi:putative PIN family toxin of toxin-antitoxin system